MKINIFIQSKQKHFIYSNETAVKKIRNEINLILKNDLSFDKDIVEKGYVVYSVKHLIKNDVFYEIYIYYVPKFWVLNSLNIINYIIDKKHEKLLVKKINEFIKKIQELDKSHNKKNKSFKSGKNDTVFFEFEYDLFILKKIHTLINRVSVSKEKQIIYSDVLVGTLDYEMNKLNNDRNIFAQNIYINDNKLFSLSNSYLYHKFNKKYLKFLNDSKKSFNPVFKDILKTLKHIKFKTNYEKQEGFLAKDLLKRTLVQPNYQKTVDKNKNLFNYLNLLLTNKVNISNHKHYRKVFFMDKIWEIYVEKYLDIYGIINTSQEDKKFIMGTNPSDCRYSRPDMITELAIADAKYKAINLKNGLIKNIDMNDINKLIRDMLFHKKYIGALIFPMKYDILKNKNNKHKKHKYEMLDGLSDYSIDIIELYF
jgi:hypothetical protein